MRWKCPTCKRWVDELIMVRCELCQERYTDRQRETKREKWEAREDTRPPEPDEADE